MNKQKRKQKKRFEFRQHNIGETFEHCKFILKICEGESCKDCFFYESGEWECNYRIPSDEGFFEPCTPIQRTDSKSVVFVKVGEVMEV